MPSARILMVDDEERFLNTTRILLAKRGIDAATAGSGPEALKVLAEAPVDVVVLDVRMPGMDGIEALRRIRELRPDVEVIMLTGHSSVETAVEGLRLGAFDYLMKPCDIPILLLKVEEAAARRRQRLEASHQRRLEAIVSHPLAAFGAGEEET